MGASMAAPTGATLEAPTGSLILAPQGGPPGGPAIPARFTTPFNPLSARAKHHYSCEATCREQFVTRVTRIPK